MNRELPKISVVTITYGHEKYITETLDGVLMQQYDGPVEFIITNDNSPDATDEVVKKYFLENPAPSNFEIKYTKHETNKGMMPNFIWALEQATGKYIALCEGDDYWTDPLKLMKQVSFLEENGEYALTVSGYVEKLNSLENNIIIKDLSDEPNYTKKGFDISINLFLRQWVTKLLTLVFRKNAIDFEILKKYKYSRDVHLIYHLLKRGKGYYFKEIFGVYRMHEGGVHSLIGEDKRQQNYYTIYKELYQHNHSDFRGKFYIVCLYFLSYLRNSKIYSNGLISAVLKDGLFAASTEHEIYDIYKAAGITNKFRIKAYVLKFKIKNKLKL